MNHDKRLLSNVFFFSFLSLVTVNGMVGAGFLFPCFLELFLYKWVDDGAGVESFLISME